MATVVIPTRRPPIENPFPGLRPFESQDSALFFGRNEHVDELIEQLHRQRFVAVVGESGSGKSSLVRAGLIPGLQRGYLAEAGSRWRIAIFRPGDDAIRSLAAKLDKTNAPAVRQRLEGSSVGLKEVAGDIVVRNQNLLVVVDQFEEIFRYTETETGNGIESAAAFVRLLLTGVRQQEVPVYVVLTMRSDYLGDCAQFRGMPEAMNGGQYLVPRMTRQQQREAIEGPIAVGGSTITPRLVRRLLNDIGDSPDQLPILQHALMRTWEVSRDSRSRGEPVDIPHFESTGGLARALSFHADSAFEAISLTNQQIAKKVFQRLTEISKSGRETRRPATVAELCAVTGADALSVITVINSFRSHGRTFLTSPDAEGLDKDSVIDISHESLIRVWDSLRGWVAEEAKNAAIYKRLAESAALELALYRKPELHQALDWKAREQPNQAWAERYDSRFGNAMQFLERSRKKEKAAYVWRVATITALCLLTTALVVLVTKWSVSQRAMDRLRRNVPAQRLVVGSNSLRNEPSLEPSLLLAVESLRQLPLVENYGAVHETLDLVRKPLVLKPPISKPGDKVYAIAASSDGRWLATGSNDNSAHIFQVSRGNDVKEVALLPHKGIVSTLAFSKDGHLLATGDNETARVFEVATHKMMPHWKHDGAVNAVAFSKNGHWVAAGNDDRTACVFEAVTGTEIARFEHEGAVNAVDFSPDGRLLATASDDGTARIFEIIGSKKVFFRKYEDEVNAVVFSKDGLLVATGSNDGWVRVFKMATGKEIARFEHEGAVNAVDFSPDNRLLATASADHTARILNVATREEVAKWGHKGEVRAVVFSPDGSLVATASDDTTVRVFAVDSKKELLRGIHQSSVNKVIFSADGSWIASGGNDGTARIFQTASSREVARLKQQRQDQVVAFSVDGRFLATGGDDNTLRVFQMTNGREVAHLPLHSPVLALAFSQDDRRIVAGTADETAQVFDWNTGFELPAIRHLPQINSVAFSPDGRQIAVGGDGKTRIFELADGKEVQPIRPGDSGNLVAFSPDGKWLATAGHKTVRIFDAANRDEMFSLAHQESVSALAFSPNSAFLVTGSKNGNPRMFTVNDGREMSLPPSQHRVDAIAFTPDSRWLALQILNGPTDGAAEIFELFTNQKVMSVEIGPYVKGLAFSEGGRRLETVSKIPGFISLQRHLLDPEDLREEACSKVTRNLTQEEWKRSVVDQPVPETCTQLPPNR